MKPVLAPTFSGQYERQLDAAPKDVFPLLCPVREYDWIPTWRCQLVHSVSGVAELGCVFTTDFPGREGLTWVCTRYEPPQAIDYAMVRPGNFVRRLCLRLEPADKGCLLRWGMSQTQLDGQALDSDFESAYAAEVEHLAQLLSHYLKTGKMYQPA